MQLVHFAVVQRAVLPLPRGISGPNCQAVTLGAVPNVNSGDRFTSIFPSS